MNTSHGITFGGAVTTVASGYYPFEIQIWAFTGQSSSNPNQWYVNFQGLARRIGETVTAIPNGFQSNYDTVRVFKTQNSIVDTSAAIPNVTLPVTYDTLVLPIIVKSNVIDSSGAPTALDSLQFTASPPTSPGGSLNIRLLDTQLQTTVNLIGSTDVVVIDPIF